MPTILHVPLYAYHSSYNHTQPKQIVQEQTDIQKQYGLAQHLAQAKESRSGETCLLRRASPSPRREHKNKGMSNTGSRLSEIPLAWASCLLAQKLSESPGRPFVQNLRRDGLAWARLTGLATVLHCNSHENRTNKAYKAVNHTKTNDLSMQSVIHSKTTKTTPKD